MSEEGALRVQHDNEISPRTGPETPRHVTYTRYLVRIAAFAALITVVIL